MAARRPVLVFDVLGTLVDQTGSLVEHVVPTTGHSHGQSLTALEDWLACVGDQERAVNDGERPLAPSHELDAEALGELARRGQLSPQAASTVASSGDVPRPWPDTVEGLDALAGHSVVMGLSNASRQILTALTDTAGQQ